MGRPYRRREMLPMSRTVARGDVSDFAGAFFLVVMWIKVGETPTVRSAKMTNMTARLAYIASSAR
jgi:hypothetical protein